MKKALILSIAALMIAAHVAQAQSRTDNHWPKAQTELRHGKSESRMVHSHSAKKNLSRKHWAKGQRMNDWKKYGSVNDYKRHGLRKPGQGQRWVRVDNDYVLISIASGIIAGIIAAQ